MGFTLPQFPFSKTFSKKAFKRSHWLLSLPNEYFMMLFQDGEGEFGALIWGTGGKGDRQ